MIITLPLMLMSVFFNIFSSFTVSTFKSKSLYLLDSYFLLLIAGACFLKKTPRGCREYIGHMSRKKCCQQSGYFVREPNEGQLFLATFLNQHSIPNCENPCSEDYCLHKTCPAGEFCIMRENDSICSSDCVCSLEQKLSGPVCSNIGRRYKNMCELHLESCWTNVQNTVVPCSRTGCELASCSGKKKCVLTLQGRVKCIKDSTCLDARYDPVCGVNNVTYSNRCHLTKASISIKREIQVAYKGVCRADANCMNVECPESGMSCINHHSNQSPVCIKCPASILECERSMYKTFELLCLSTKYETRNTCYKDYLSCQNNVFIEIVNSGHCLLNAKWPRK